MQQPKYLLVTIGAQALLVVGQIYLELDPKAFWPLYAVLSLVSILLAPSLSNLGSQSIEIRGNGVIVRTTSFSTDPPKLNIEASGHVLVEHSQLSPSTAQVVLQYAGVVVVVLVGAILVAIL